MLNFTAREIRDIIKEYVFLHDRFDLQPVGNHELNRHLVYKATPVDGEPIIFKMYYKTNRRSREIASLRLLREKGIRCPEIVGHGVLPTGEEWLVMKCLQGEPLEKVQNLVSRADLLTIFTEMGRELGKIHRCSVFEGFGNWDETGQVLQPKDNYLDVLKASLKWMHTEIVAQQLAEEEFLMAAIAKLEAHVDLFAGISEARLSYSDYDGRNVLVKNVAGRWVFSAVIDFEQATPGNSENDLIQLYHKCFLNDDELKTAFLQGYGETWRLDAGFNDRLNYYLLREGVGICSWAKKVAPDYYMEGVRLVKNFIDKV